MSVIGMFVILICYFLLKKKINLDAAGEFADRATCSFGIKQIQR
jgi:hypothetical protein